MPTKTIQGDIRLRAFNLWNMRGQPHGYEVKFWLQAERELEGERPGRVVSPDGDFVKSGSGSDCCCCPDVLPPPPSRDPHSDAPRP
jgi:hypothetical protein